MTVLPEGAFGDRVRARLTTEQVVWFTSVGDDGTPQPNPVWFHWDGDRTIRVYNRRDAARLRHIAERPHVALHFDGNGRGGDIVVFTGTARESSDAAGPDRDSEYVAKYRDAMIRVGGSLEDFATAYPVAVDVVIRRIRGH